MFTGPTPESNGDSLQPGWLTQGQADTLKSFAGAL
jgi:hypothetical protein